MFKGLKSKIEDEAKKLQVSMQQYGEQLSQQVGQYRSAASDAGSDSTSISRRFLNTGGGTSNMTSALNDALSVDDALEEDATGELSLDLSRRERRFSGGSTRSHESSLSTFFQSVPGLTAAVLESVESDQESTLDEHGPGVFHSSSEEQITSLLSKLKGRVANYKDKYSDLLKKYNDAVNENNKCRAVLVQTQDKALSNIEKLRTEKRILGEKLKDLTEKCNGDNQLEIITQRYENMLEKLRSEITKNRSNIKSLTEENRNLKSEINSINGDSGISALVAERISSEWKQRIEKVEDEWTARINTSDSDHAIQLATTKAEMHAALEGKDKEIELWRGKCRALEIQDGQANERWQSKVDELQLVIKALECEKADMIEKLSTAKQQGVKAVLDEEEKKREEMITEWNAKERRTALETDERIKEIELRHKAELEIVKSQMEEYKMRQKLEDSDEIFLIKDHELINENVREERTVSEQECQVGDHEETMEFDSLKQHIKMEKLVREHEDILVLTRKQHELELKAITDRYEHVQLEADQLREKVDDLEQQIEQWTNVVEESSKRERNLKEQLDSCKKSGSIESTSEINEKIAPELWDFNNMYSKALENLEDERSKALENSKRADNTINQLHQEITELKLLLEKNNESTRKMEEKHQKTEIELATAKELSVSYEHLQSELEEVRQQRSEVEIMVSELRQRAEKAEKMLQEDRIRLEHDRSLFESSDVVEKCEDSQNLTPQNILQNPNAYITNENGMEEMKEELRRATEMKLVVEEEMQQLKQENHMLCLANKQYVLDIAKLEESVNIYEIRKGELDDKIIGLEKHSVELQQLVDTLQRALDDEKSLTTEQSVDYEKMSKAFHEMEAILVDEKKRIVDLESANKRQQNDADIELRNLHTRIKQLEAELSKSMEQSEIFRDEQEKLISNLRAEIICIQNDATEKLHELQEKLLLSETNLSTVSEQLQSCEEVKERERTEGIRFREQHSTILENLKSELILSQSRLDQSSKLEVENSNLRECLETIKSEQEDLKQKQKEESDAHVLEIKQKAEKKIVKMKALFDRDISALKAEMLLEINELRESVIERDRRFDEVISEKARIEQQLISQEDIIKELDLKRATVNELTEKFSNNEQRIIELEADNKMLSDRHRKMEEMYQKNHEDLDKSSKLTEDLKGKIKLLEEVNEEGFRKAAAKQDTDNRKVLRELQKEVKQLYVELNEKTEALDKLRDHLAEKEMLNVAVKASTLEDSSQKDYVYEEELESMRKKLSDCHREIDGLREINSRLEKDLDLQKGQSSGSPAIINVMGNSNDSPGFTDHAEAQYLKNVLYRYMSEREILGKETVTLARVIGTVAKFSNAEMEAVLAREESRVAGWVGGAVSQVSHAFTGHR